MSETLELDQNQVFNKTPGGAATGNASTERITFSGTGSEYFGIWIVNILLSILTLGIYSAWAKVRRTRYFYDNTRLAGSSFEYHGNPVAILKGRIIAFVLLVVYQGAFALNVWLGVGIVVVLAAIVPWLVWRSLQFKLYNSSYRGIRFGFRGSVGKAYEAYLLMPFIAAITFYLGVPYAHQRIKKFQHDESRFGTTHFSFHATVGSFYIVYLIGFLVMMAGGAVIGFVAGFGFAASKVAGASMGAGAALIFMLVVFATFAWIAAVFPLLMTLTQNLIWNNTRLGEYQFGSDLKWRRTAFIVFTNIIGIVLTLGLYSPFAKIRMLKNRIEAISLTQDGGLEDFVAGEQQNASAVGEGVADLLDFDISL
jgi:uncharacterized membrane protein YjgN (DUF898 family)